MVYYLPRFFFQEMSFVFSCWAIEIMTTEWFVYKCLIFTNHSILSLIISGCIESFQILLIKAFVVVECTFYFLLLISLIAVVIRFSIVNMLLWYAFMSEIVNINWICSINCNRTNNATISVKNFIMKRHKTGLPV